MLIDDKLMSASATEGPRIGKKLRKTSQCNCDGRLYTDKRRLH